MAGVTPQLWFSLVRLDTLLNHGSQRVIFPDAEHYHWPLVGTHFPSHGG